jgi:hypothetical protein
LQPRLRRITDKGQEHVRQFLQRLAAAGTFACSESDIDRLVINAWIVGTYWIDYLRSRQGVQTVTRQHLRWGLAQVEALFTPYASVSGTPKTGPREGEAPSYGHAH